MKAINITAYTEDVSQIEAVQAIKAFKIKYKVSKIEDDESPYDPEFVAMIKKREQHLKEGKGVNITLAELECLCK